MSEAPQLFATIEVDRGVLTARLVGPSIGQREGPVIAGMIQKELTAGDAVGWVVLDFREIDYINSAGIGSCVSIHNDCKGHKAKVVLHALKDNIHEVFKMTKLDKIFKIAANDKKLDKIVGR